MADHCFISYSNIDGLEFARQLANELEGGEDKYVNVWFDKRDLKAGVDWRPQLAEAIRDCKFLLFVMTNDSVEPQSVTNEEWAFALKYKKPIIPLKFHSGVDLPFGSGRRQWIDFTGEFKHGLARLRKRLADLDSPQGQLQLLRDRLADAERDLRRASPEDEARVKNEIKEIKNDIQQQELIIKDPNKAEKLTRKNISSGLQIERQSKKTVTEILSTKFINPIPFMAPRYFQGRSLEIQEIADFLKDNDQRVLTIIGRAGGGKTALACHVLKSLESGKLPEDLGELKIGGIVYLSEIGSHKVNVANIYIDLLQLLSKEKANKLDTLYRQPKISIGDKVRALLEEFRSDPVLLLLDNFELFVDTETEDLLDLELKETLENLLRAPQHSIKVIITTRVPALDLALTEPGRQNTLHLDEGLGSPFAENVLRALDKDGKAGLKDASDELLGRARELTRGYPRALESLYAIISVDRYTNIEELLAVDLPEKVVENLVGEAYSRLDINAQKVIQALAVYDRPVPASAIDFLLQFHIPGINSAPILNRLVNIHFARREAGRFYLHPTDREYAFERIPEGKLDKQIGKGARSRLWNQRALLLRAADYYVEARKPQSEWKKLDDLSAQLAEFDLRYAAEDYDSAADVLDDICSHYLHVWGHYQLMIDLLLRVKDRVQAKELRHSTLNSFGYVNQYLGNIKESIVIYERALVDARRDKDLGWESIFLNNLGNGYLELGEIRKAIDTYNQALAIDRESNDTYGESASLTGLGLAYSDSGEFDKALEFYEQVVFHARSNHDKEQEAVCLGNSGDALLEMDNIEQAIDKYLQAIQLASEISFTATQNYARWGLAQAYLLQNNLALAHNILVEAQKYDLPTTNHDITTILGIITLRENDLPSAKEAFLRSITQADEILQQTPGFYDALDAKGLALCGLAILEDEDHIILAKDTFRAARQITKGVGIVKRTLRLFDEIAKADTEGVLSEVRSFVEGKE